jgi:response regulator RpfG family c-di-GMP phosphodiesterase
VTHPFETESKRCLIVDDEAALRQPLARLMERGGFECFEADSAEEALEILARQPVTLVLSDLCMGGMDGRALLARVRECYPDVAVIMLTGVTQVEVAVSCLSAGAMDYITKPFVLDEVCARVAQAMEKRRLLRENREYRERLELRVREQAVRLEELYLGGIQSLAAALELKDPYTRGHSERVSRHGGQIARTLGLGATMVRSIELGGQLHDVGKIGVRESVLNKPGPLTREEYQHIMTHPLLGWRILHPLLGHESSVLNVVRSHHERLDGSGVPDGLAGDQIPLEARIISVADAYDAMMSRRPYRAGLRAADALAELRREAGSQFDPMVVEAFVRTWRRAPLRVAAQRGSASATFGGSPAGRGEGA